MNIGWHLILDSEYSICKHTSFLKDLCKIAVRRQLTPLSLSPVSVNNISNEISPDLGRLFAVHLQDTTDPILPILGTKEYEPILLVFR